MTTPNIPTGANLYSTFGTTSSNNITNAVIATRAPTSTDTRGPNGNFSIGQIWVDRSTPAAYVLGNISTSSGTTTASWLLSALGAGDLETLSGDTGTASPVSSNINIVGSGDVSTAASGDTITISFSAGTTAIDQINGDSGSVAPVGGAVTLNGGLNCLTFTGSGSTMAAAFDNELQGACIQSISGTAFLTALGVGSASGLSTTNVTGLGYNALNLNTSGDSNTAVGSLSLAALVTGNNATACGASALASNTASEVTAVGASALRLNTSGTHNTACGYNAGAALVTSGDCTAVGWEAFQAGTGAANTAIGSAALSAAGTQANCTALGYNALLSATTSGDNNTAVGSTALSAITSGTDAVGIGYAALVSNTASEVTGVGSQALTNNTTGTHNSALGYNAASQISTATDCTAIGWSAFQGTGANNTAIGSGALNSPGTYTSQTAVGRNALASATTGADLNVAVGSASGQLLTTANSCTLVGARCCAALTTGIQNTGLGDAAGIALTTGASNTLVGQSAGVNLVTGSNNLALGQSAGNAWTGAESANIALASTGVVGVSNRINIGSNGTHTTAFIAGIRGVTTANADAVAVLVDSADQLGTVSSSIRYKQDVVNLSDSERIYDLRPVTFKYKSQESWRPQFGLIAEEVYDVIPEIVVHDKEGKIDTIQYQTLPIFLLAEVQKLRKEINELKGE